MPLEKSERPEPPDSDGIRLAIEAIKAADALLIGAGAGMGVDSGLPDFRGQSGFWRAYPVLAGKRISFEEMASPSWFRDDPHLAWAFYGHRLNLYRKTEPHEGFKWLLEIGRSKPEGYFVFTSNVDGQFQKAGFADDRIVECHGSIHHFQCIRPCSSEIWDAAVETVSIDESSFRALEPLPKCLRCKALARPNVLMYGDMHWIGGRSEAQERRFVLWLQRLTTSNARLAVIELGAGTAIPSVRYASQSSLQTVDSTLIRINPRDHEVPAGHIGLPFGALEGIRRIYEGLD